MPIDLSASSNSPDPFCYLQMALAPDGQGFVYLEAYRTKLVDSDQAALIAEVCAQDPPEYIAAPPDLFNVSGKGIRGQSTAETYQQVWSKCGFRTQLRRGANDRLQGWRRVREWLKPHLSADGQGQTARLQIVAGRCPNLVRTLPQLVHDEYKPEDLDTTGEDHAADALRYGLMSRPAPRPSVSLQVLEDYWAADPLIKRVMNRGRRTACPSSSTVTR